MGGFEVGDFELSDEEIQIVTRSKPYRDAVKKIGDDLANTARDLASAEYPHSTGLYRKGINSGWATDTKDSTYRVSFRSFLANWLEWGTQLMQGKHIATRSIESVVRRQGGDLS